MLAEEDGGENATTSNEFGDEGDVENGAFTESFVLEHNETTQREDDSILDLLEGRQEEQAYLQPCSDQPMNEYTVKLLMQSCFPTLFPHGLGGFHPIELIEQRCHSYKLAEYCAHLMAWHHRRFIIHPNFKFFCLNIIQRRQIDGLLRQVRHHEQPTGSNNELGRDATDNSTVAFATRPSSDETTHNVSSYLKELKPFFRSVRGSGLYWANVRDELMCMIGNPAMENPWPTFFVTLSAADTVWPDFFRVCDPNLSFEEAATLTPSQRRKYLNENPDLAARHFHRRFRAFFRYILCGDSKPLGEIEDFFWRIEFQHRGSPHVHALLWIKGAPNILELSKTEDGRKKLAAFADRFVSCMRRHKQLVPDTSMSDTTIDPLCIRPPPTNMQAERAADLRNVVDRVQQHVCSSKSSCQRNGACRFGFPKTLEPATRVVRDVNGGAIHIKFHHKRDDPFTNNYNPTMLLTWRANIDVKIIGNAYGAAEYTAAYVSKAEPDSVRFRKSIEAALAKMPEGTPYQSLLRRTATAVLAIREVSAQETVYILSNNLCLTEKSRSVSRVKVSRHHQRYYRVRIDGCSGNSCISQSEGPLKLEATELAYMKRPRSTMFDEMPYRDFCELFEVSRTIPKCSQGLKRWDLLDGCGLIKERHKKQIIRPTPRYFTDESDPNYCYAQLFLHKPWRLLSDLPVEDEVVCQVYAEWRNDEASPWTRYIGEMVERERILESNRGVDLPLPSPSWSTLPIDGRLSDECLPCEAVPSAILFRSRFSYSSDDVVRARRFLQDVVRPFTDEVKPVETSSNAFIYSYPIDGNPPCLSEDQWRPFSIIMRQNRLRNLSEREKSNCTPIRMVVSGEGGTGKSWLIRQIIQDVRTVFGPTSRKRMLLMAHLGSAAYLIGGRTLTAALALPSQCGSIFRRAYIPLSTNKEATLRRLQNEYELVHLIVVDKFSVISCGMMHWIDQRLREIFVNHRHLPFGGRDIIFTGDPFQLGPVNPHSLLTPLETLLSSSEQCGRALWLDIEYYFILRTQNRGKEDPEWYDVLRHVREGCATDDDLELINARVLPPPKTCLEPPVYISYRNADVNDANEAALRLLNRPVCATPRSTSSHR